MQKKTKYVSKHSSNEPEKVRTREKKEKTIKEPRERKPVKIHIGKKAVFIILGVVALVVLAAVGGGLAVTKSNVNLPKMTIGDIDVGKLTREQTIEKLSAGGWDDRISQNLIVTSIGDQSVEIDPVKSGAMLPKEMAADMAYEYGHSGNIFENLALYLADAAAGIDINKHYQSVSDSYVNDCIAQLEQKVEDYLGTDAYTLDLENSVINIKKGVNELRLNEEGLKEAIHSALKNGDTSLTYKEIAKDLTCPDFNAVRKELERDPVDASYTDDNKFGVIDEVVGCKLNPENAAAIWMSAQPGEEISVPIDVTWPKVTGEFLRGQLFRDLLGAMTTEFPASAPDRVSNVNLCASRITDVIVYPGEVFSYNEHVGPRTREAGFLVAPAYVDGEVKDEVGGGACQVSSTTYAASLFAFLETVERTCHQFPVSYMQLGTDATVAWPEDGVIVDFKFRNNKSFPVKVVAHCDTENKNITVEIWGTLEDSDFMPVEFDNRYTWVNTYDRTIEPAYEGREGYIIKLTHDLYTQDDSTMTQTHRRVLDLSGNEVSDEVVNTKLPNGVPSMDTYYSHP